ncbi:MAG: hypothetical protein ABIN80_31020 [Dyadobacter sp.]|uniref:hypothetical protein n=1 Tax=Dyadobacter sp. TaxID=1914288 RepID=UPI003264EA5E
METTEKQLSGMTEAEEKEFLNMVLEKTRGRDLFPEKTARAREFLKALEANGQRLIPENFKGVRS